METNSGLLTFLLNSLWQIPLIAAVAALVCQLMRNGPANHRHVVWAAALIAAALLPVLSIHSNGQNTGARMAFDNLIQWNASAPAATRSTLERLPTPPVSAAKRRAVPLPATIATAVIVAYLLFVLFRVAGLVRASIQTVRIRAEAEVPTLPELIDNVWNHCREAMDLRRVALLTSIRISCPVTVGNAIVLPQSMLSEQLEDVLTTSIGHETAHLARRDFSLNLVYELLYLPISFHPAAWVIHRAIQRTREIACDELVTQRLLQPRVYARSIMTIAAGISGHSSPGYTLGVFDGDILEERIRRLMERPVANLKRARLFLASALTALAICAIAAAGLAMSARAQGAATGEMKLAVEAYNSQDVSGAIGHFENATTLEPANVTIKLFLASAYLRAFATDKKAKDDSPLIAHAREQYQDALRIDPGNKQAVNGMIAVCLDAKQFAGAREWAMKLMKLDSHDKQTYFQIAFIDFNITFPPVQQARIAAHIQPKFTSHGMLDATNAATVQLPDPAVRKALQATLMPQIAEGLRMLQTALQLDPNYWAAMSYIGQLLRLEASLADDPSFSLNLIVQSNEWMDKTEAEVSIKTHPPAQTQIDVDGPPPSPSVSVRM